MYNFLNYSFISIIKRKEKLSKIMIIVKIRIIYYTKLGFFFGFKINIFITNIPPDKQNSSIPY